MKLRILHCPSCHASLKLDSKKQDFLYCPYCGAQISLESDNDEYTVNYNYTKNINHTERIVNEAEIIRAKNEGKKIHINFGEGSGALAMLLVFCLVLFGMAAFLESGEEKKAQIAVSEGKISAGYYNDYIEKNYVSVQKQLEAAGFTNVEVVDLNDAGLFKNKKDTVENVSVNGDSSFSSSDYFDKDATVVITYH